MRILSTIKGVLRKMRLLGNSVLIEPIKEKKTGGGLYLPDGVSKETYFKAKVLAVGPGRYNHNTGVLVPIGVNVGETVLVANNEYGDYRVLEGEEISGVLIAGDNILCVL
jgi:co-chaperonin GroES (HSP10)